MSIVFSLRGLLFRRRIEMYGLALCLAGYLAAGFTVDILRHVGWARYIFNYLWLFAISGFAFFVAYIIGRLRGVLSFTSLLLFPPLFGFCTGYLYAWIDSDYAGSFPYIDLFERSTILWLPAAPGDFITNARVLGGADWQGGEIWHFANEIALWNSFVWAIVGYAIATFIYFVFRCYRQNHPEGTPCT